MPCCRSSGLGRLGARAGGIRVRAAVRPGRSLGDRLVVKMRRRLRLCHRRDRCAEGTMKRYLAGFAAALVAGSAASADISGTLSLYSAGQALRASESEDAVVYFRPSRPVVAAAAREPSLMSTRRKQFVPRVLAIPAGSSVRFPNEDTILHNVFSRSPDNSFDAGLYGAGNGFVQKFEHPGPVKVY